MSMDECCYVCNECPNSYATLDDLEQHMESTHAGLNRTEPTLPRAPRTPERSEPLREEDEGLVVDDTKDNNMDHDGHEAESGGNSPSSSDISNFDATMDGVGYGMDETMNGDEGKGFGCRFCPKIFEERSQLNVHYTHTHRDKPQYECDECHTVFAVKRELSTHMRIHSGEQPHTCTQCGKEFGTRQLLKKHWMWHTGERSHVCPHCGKAFFQKGHLTQHLMIHAGGRPHQCQLCQKTFIFKFDLNRHMKIHAERGFSCEKCGRSFIKQLQLDEHLLKCKGTPGNRSHSTTRTSTPLSDVSKIDSNSPRRHSNSSLPAVNFSHDDMNKVAQVLVAQQQQRALAAAAAAQQNAAAAQVVSTNPLFQANALQNFAENLMANGVVSAQQSQQSQQHNGQNNFFCIFCMKHFNTQASFTLHLSFVHFRNGVLNPNPQSINTNASNTTGEMKLNPSLLPSAVFVPPIPLSTANDGSTSIAHSDSATSSSCASSPQKISPVIATTVSRSPTHLSDSDNLSGGSESPDTMIPKVCANCESNRQRVLELERTLAAKQLELKNTRELMRRISAIAGSLLESCTDFDKQWVSHSRKVYSQIQSVICNME
uniref:Zinc finger protein 484 n=1 Tax=Ascaris suum TaxID=6253 RepID=F1L0V4_ASCSU